MDPCEMCCDYPYWCRGICVDKTKYMNEVDGDVPIIRSQENKTLRSSMFYDRGKRYEYNKNGIRREL